MATTAPYKRQTLQLGDIIEIYSITHIIAFATRFSSRAGDVMRYIIGISVSTEHGGVELINKSIHLGRISKDVGRYLHRVEGKDTAPLNEKETDEYSLKDT